MLASHIRIVTVYLLTGLSHSKCGLCCQGQAVELEAHAVRGTGREHAKWSPISTAWCLPCYVCLSVPGGPVWH